MTSIHSKNKHEELEQWTSICPMYGVNIVSYPSNYNQFYNKTYPYRVGLFLKSFLVFSSLTLSKLIKTEPRENKPGVSFYYQ